MKHMPSKFRKVKTEISVGGKLPKSSFYPSLKDFQKTVGSVGHTTLSIEPELERDWDLFFSTIRNKDLKKVSIIDSKKMSVSVIQEHEIVLSTSFILFLADKAIIISEIDDKYHEDRRLEARLIALKLIDIVYHVSESCYEVVSTQISDVEKRMGYWGHRAEKLSKRRNPFLSKRYEKTSFYKEAKELYGGVMDFSDWDSNLEEFKNGLPSHVLKSELIFCRGFIGK